MILAQRVRLKQPKKSGAASPKATPRESKREREREREREPLLPPSMKPLDAIFYYFFAQTSKFIAFDSFDVYICIIIS
jgi:hypothetical protein